MNYKKLSKIADSANKVKDPYLDVNYDWEGIYDLEGNDPSELAKWEADDNVLSLRLKGLDNPVADVWVDSDNTVRGNLDKEYLQSLLKDDESIEALADYHEITSDEVKNKLNDLLTNLTKIVNDKINEVFKAARKDKIKAVIRYIR